MNVLNLMAAFCLALLAGCAGPPQTKRPLKSASLSEHEVQRLLQLHNQDRKQVGIEPLVWSPILGGYAQEWADHLAADGCGMAHRPNEGGWKQRYGENLFIGTAGAYGVEEGYGVWAGEQAEYDGGLITRGNVHRVGHYTQIVWGKTLELGCAKVRCEDMLILVCNYDPAGNYLGFRPY
ncbi:CAP domain-containing protein [Pseudomonadota bacterium]